MPPNTLAETLEAAEEGAGRVAVSYARGHPQVFATAEERTPRQEGNGYAFQPLDTA